MYKKIIYSFIVLLFCSGCTANYRLNIDRDNITEKLQITGIDNSNFKANNVPINYEYDDPAVFEKRLDDVKYYEFKKNNNKVIYNYRFNTEEFYNSTFLHRCYDEVDTYIDGQSFIISTTGDFKCYEIYDELDDVNISIYSQYKLVNTNADKKDGFNYIWNINKNNISNGVYLELDLSDRKETLQEKFINSNFFNTIIFTGLVIVAFIVFIIFKKISEAKDKI